MKITHFKIAILFTPLFFFPAWAQNNNDFQTVLNYTLSTSPRLKGIDYDLKALSERYPQALAGWRPSLSAEGQIYHSDIENSNFAGATGSTTKEMQVTLEQPLYQSGQTTARTDQAKDLIRSGYMSRNAEIQRIILDTLRAYLDIKRDSDLAQLQSENVGFITSELKSTQARHNLGELTMTDIHQNESRLQDARARQLLAETELNNSMTAFEQITGLYPSPDLPDINLAFELPDDAKTAADRALENNPEIMAAQYAHRAALDNTKADFRTLFPSLFAFASYNKQFDPQPGIVDQSENKTIGLRLSIPLYQGGAQRSRIRESKYRAAKRQTDIDAIKRQVQHDFILAWRRYLTATAELNLRDQQVKSAYEARQGIAETAKMGERTTLDVLDADREMIAAKSARIHAHYKLQAAKAEVAKTMGELSPELFGVNYQLEASQKRIEELRGKYFTIAAD